MPENGHLAEKKLPLAAGLPVRVVRLSAVRPLAARDGGDAFEAAAGEPHFHLAGQVYLLEAGLVTIDSPRGRLVAVPRRLGWIPPGVLHRALGHGPISGLVGHVVLEACESLPPEPALLEAGDLAGPLMARLAAWRGEVGDQRTARLAEALLDELAAAPQAGPTLPLPQSEGLRRLCEALMAGGEASEPADWARGQNVSLRTLTRRFEAETGLTPLAWRRALRLTRARELLADGEAVSQTAWRVGYESVGAFIEAFKAVFGLTPGAWAKLAGAVEVEEAGAEEGETEEGGTEEGEGEEARKGRKGRKR
jgi:AraC-like DNA-binding protein